MKSRTAALALVVVVLAPQAAALARPQTVNLSPAALRRRAVTCKAPAYNPRLQVAASVVVEILVDEAGRVRDARVVSGHPLLHAGAVQAVGEWAFRPLKVRGGAARFKGLLTLRFSYHAEEMRRQCRGLARTPEPHAPRPRH